MDNAEARLVLQKHLQPWRQRSWTELRQQVGTSQHSDVTGGTDSVYQCEVQVFWDDKPEGAIRVLGSIDDGGWRAVMPISQDFLLQPGGRGVQE